MFKWLENRKKAREQELERIDSYIAFQAAMARWALVSEEWVAKRHEILHRKFYLKSNGLVWRKFEL